MKKKTHEEYVEEVKEKNPTVEVIGEYVDAKTKIMHHCLIHDTYWESLPSNILKGKGCKECMKDKNRNKFLKSHEQYVEEVNNLYQYIEVLEKYAGSNVAILHRCNKHDVEWNAYPSNILRGEGCCECGKEKYHEKRSKKHSEYVKELAVKNPYIEVVDEYKYSNTPIKHHCLIHDSYWNICPSNALRGDGCPQCQKDRKRDVMVKSNDEYILELSNKNPSIEEVEEYIDCKTPIMHHCLIHNVYWKATPSNVLKGCGCIECGKEKIREKIKLTNEEYISMVNEMNEFIVPIEKYIDMKTPILHKCIKHNIEWKTTPQSVLQGCGCYICRSEKIKNKLLKTNEEYVNEVSIINTNIIVVENYIDAKTPILHKCKIDGYEWKTATNNILNGSGCPKCNESKGEKMVSKCLDNNNIYYIQEKFFEDCIDIKPLPFDFYIPDYNICIEYQGKQHYEPVEHFGGEETFKIQQRHDNIKKEYCEKNGIHLLCISYLDFDNIEKLVLYYLRMYGYKKK